MKIQSDYYDIVVLGSGLVGSSFTLALCRQVPDIKVAVIDKMEKMILPAASEHIHARAIALSHNSMEILKSLHVWPSLQNDCTAIKEVHVSSKGKFGVARLTPNTCLTDTMKDVSALGAVVDADVLNASLYATSENLPGLTIFRPDEICEIYSIESDIKVDPADINNLDPYDRKTRLWKIVLASGKILTTRLLVGADGTTSFIRKRFGVDANIEDYRQQAIVSNIILQEDHHQVAYERFLSDAGAASLTSNESIALLPFGEKRVKCILVTHQNNLQELLSLSDQEYLAKLQAYFGYRLGRFKALGKRSSYSLKGMSAETLYAPGWVLLGNAANTLHPLAAQGFNLGLRDAVTLAEMVSRTSTQQGRDTISNIELLQSYAESRKSDHFTTREFTQTLVKRKWLTHLGILGCEFLPELKNRITRQGLGMGMI